MDKQKIWFDRNAPPLCEGWLWCRCPQEVVERFAGRKLYIWLDDLRPAPSPDWVWCRWPEAVIELLDGRSGQVERVALDNDLGDPDPEKEGLRVAKWLQEHAICDGYIPPEVMVQSDNSTAIEAIRGICDSIFRHTGHDIYVPFIKEGELNQVV